MESLSFTIRHELTHIYLANNCNNIPELNEFKCDCYAINLYNRHAVEGYKDLDLHLGIFNNLLRLSIKENRPDLWNIDNIDPLKLRFSKLYQWLTQKVSMTDCQN